MHNALIFVLQQGYNMAPFLYEKHPNNDRILRQARSAFADTAMSNVGKV
jgi:hypothetical protein